MRTRSHQAHHAAAAELRCRSGRAARRGAGGAARTGVEFSAAAGYVASLTGDATTGAGVRDGADDVGARRDGLGAAEAGDAEVGAAERWAGTGLSAVGRPGPGDWLISTPTPAITAATAITPPRTVMDVRKLISSMRAYSPFRKAVNVRVREPGLLPSDEPGIATDNTRRSQEIPT